MSTAPQVGIIMGSTSDLDVMMPAAEMLESFGISCEVRIISAHRTPAAMRTYASEAAGRGLKIIIAGAGGSAHLPGMTASETDLPVVAVPVKRDNHDHEALWSNIKMPPGIPLATMPENGAKNAALLAVRILALQDADIAKKYRLFCQKQHDDVIAEDVKIQKEGWRA
jgi:5-(carboxyamino)imidazole ribonucleotide mutase